MTKSHFLHEIIFGIQQANQKLGIWDIEYQAKIKLERDKIARLQEQCGKELKHSVQDYFPDASGNNDSTTECAICGKELR